jgi:hypothetical protein
LPDWIGSNDDYFLQDNEQDQGSEIPQSLLKLFFWKLFEVLKTAFSEDSRITLETVLQKVRLHLQP